MSFKDLVDVEKRFKDKSKNFQVPYSAAEIKNKNDFEEDVYKVSFKYYHRRKCELEEVQRSCHRKILKWFRDLGECKTREDVKEIGLSYTTPINQKSGKGSKYTNLANFVKSSLTDDVEILHEDISKSSRMFYFLTNADKVLNVVLIANGHWD